MHRTITAHRVVVKVGTSTLINKNGTINLTAIDQLAFALTSLKNAGHEVVLVSSGAIGVGLTRLNQTKRPSDIPSQQALAAVGQTMLITIYQQRFSNYGQKIGQVLLTHDVLAYPQSETNAKNTFNRLLELGIIPIVNENDTVAVDEMDHHTKFGDNDQLSAMVANLIDADLLIMLSDIEGFYTANPNTDPTAKLISHVDAVDQATYDQAGGAGSKFGTGGMVTKLKAAQRVNAQGRPMILASGEDPAIVTDLMAGADRGTYFGKLPE